MIFKCNAIVRVRLLRISAACCSYIQLLSLRSVLLYLQMESSTTEISIVPKAVANTEEYCVHLQPSWKLGTIAYVPYYDTAKTLRIVRTKEQRTSLFTAALN